MVVVFRKDANDDDTTHFVCDNARFFRKID